ncbi:ribonuclease H [Senna tora]|uniref:Ribonuclease H n=1 Tax=Senna tora TaxID=362788 RepID=A0A834X6W8_9FABA|nr:ribonuclease H [Senna tora]
MKRVDTEGLMEKLAQLSIKEKRTTFINPDSETSIVARDHGVAHGGKTMESDGVTSEITRGGEDDKIPKISRGNKGMGNKNANPDQEKTIRRVVKGGVTTWKRMAREKENLVPVEVIKKRMFHDLTNAMECSEEDVQLDRALINQEWGSLFPNHKMWTAHNEFANIIKEGWRSISLLREGNHIAGKMEVIKTELTRWNKEEFGNVGVRYFQTIRNGTFMEAGLGSNPSFTWRSILHGREVLKKGLIRRIGDGVKTNLFNTQWIPSIENFSSPYTNQQMGLDATVNMLFMQDSKTWNVPLIMQNFEPTIAKAILSIPLSKTGAVDVWMWKFSNNGVFNVKSAYKAIHKSYETSNGWRVYKLVWKRIWNMNVTPIVKNFMWRACRNILPTCVNLKGRGLDIDEKCFICNDSCETTLHALCDCSNVQGLWRDSSIGMGATNEMSFIEWLKGQMEKLSTKDFDIMCIMMHRVWDRRNKIIKNG